MEFRDSNKMDIVAVKSEMMEIEVLLDASEETIADEEHFDSWSRYNEEKVINDENSGHSILTKKDKRQLEQRLVELNRRLEYLERLRKDEFNQRAKSAERASSSRSRYERD